MLTLCIDRDKLIRNILYISSMTSARLCAVVKANAYGHGLETARILDGYVDCFAVANGDEAMRLRTVTAKEIYVLSPSEDVDDRNVIYSVSGENDLHHSRVCLKINSGMNRLGARPERAERLLAECKLRGITVDSVYTHFSDVEYAPVQFERFMTVGGDYMRHACASNFLKLDVKFHLDMVRVGLALYGYGDPRLQPIMTATTEVYNVLNVRKGDKIGYVKEADRDMKIAVLGAGYADRIARREQSFYIGGKVCRTVGDICMDMCLVDVSGLDVKAGDRAEFLGEHIGGETVARNNETVVYDILTSFGHRCRRIYE